MHLPFPDYETTRNTLKRTPLLGWLVVRYKWNVLNRKVRSGSQNLSVDGVLSEVAKYYSVLGDNWDFEDCPLYRRYVHS